MANHVAKFRRLVCNLLSATRGKDQACHTELNMSVRGSAGGMTSCKANLSNLPLLGEKRLEKGTRKVSSHSSAAAAAVSRVFPCDSFELVHAPSPSTAAAAATTTLLAMLRETIWFGHRLEVK